MATYVQLGAVKTWDDEHGQGEPLVLLHGGLVDARFFEPNLPALVEHFHVDTPERRRTWSATATARSWRCWSRSSVRSWSSGW
jgi:hypothetical protein